MRIGLVLAGALFLFACKSNGGPELFDLGVAFSLQGNENLSEGEIFDRIRDEIQVPASRAPTKAEVDDAAYAIEELYRENGFPFVRVNYDYFDDPNRTHHAQFLITEGQRVLLDEIVFQGNTAFDGSELEGFLPTEADGLPSGDRVYVEGHVDDLTAAVHELYFQSGYLLSRVDAPEVRFDEEAGSAHVTVVVHEGPRFHLRSVSFDGELAFPAEEHEALVAASLNTTYVPRLSFELRARVLEAYQRRGYPESSAQLDVQRDELSGDVALTLEIVPGPLVTIAEIRIEGNEHTRTSMIRRRLRLAEGMRYDSVVIREAFQRLFRSSLFHGIRIELDERKGESERALVVHVEEAPTLELFVEPGWGSYEGPRLTAGITERNLAGTWLQLSIEANVSPKDQGARVRLTEPWLYSADSTGTIEVFGRHREEPSFTVNEIGTGMSVTERWSSKLRTTVGHEFLRSDLSDEDVDDPDAEEDINVSSISISTVHDTTDRLIRPRRGNRSRIKLEWAFEEIGSGVNYVSTELSHRQLLALAEKTVLAVRGRTGVISPQGDDNTIPLQLRYYNGGENSVRSFKEDELGPKDASGDPLGGEAYSVLSVELRQGIVGNLATAAFVDYGNVTSNASDYFDFDEFRAAVGMGIRYWLPVGPLRLDVGFNPNPRDDEDDFVVHFAVGMAF